MKALITLINRRLFHSYSATRSFYSVSVTSNIGSQRFLKSNQPILKVALTATEHTVKMSSSNPIKTANYEDIKGLSNNNTVLLVDVREPSELNETGILPGSINIPLGELENVLQNVSADEFAKRFGRSKPALNFPVVFSCRSGVRSKKASEAARKLGYQDVTNYVGGWLDWEEHSKTT